MFDDPDAGARARVLGRIRYPCHIRQPRIVEPSVAAVCDDERIAPLDPSAHGVLGAAEDVVEAHQRRTHDKVVLPEIGADRVGVVYAVVLKRDAVLGQTVIEIVHVIIELADRMDDHRPERRGGIGWSGVDDGRGTVRRQTGKKHLAHQQPSNRDTVQSVGAISGGPFNYFHHFPFFYHRNARGP